MVSYYEILEVNPNASQDEIRKSFRQLSLRYHPDRNSSSKSEAKFKDLNEAYQILGNQESREKYDKTQRNNVHVSNVSNIKLNNLSDIEKLYHQIMNNNFSNNSQPFDILLNNLSNEYSNIFQEVFTGMLNNDSNNIFNGSSVIFPNFNNINKQIETIKINYTLTLEQIYSGCSIKIMYTRRKIHQHNNEIQEQIYKDIDIESGIDISKPMILKNEGHYFYNTYGDVELTFKQEHHNVYKRNGLNLIMEKTISLKEALTGFSITFLHINNKQYTIQNNEQIIFPNTHKEIPNMGITNNNTTGSLFIIFNVEFPTTLTNEIKIKLKEIL